MPENEPGVVLVRELLGQELVELQLSVLSGESNLGREITHPRVQKPGLAFAGHYEYIKPGRVQIIGASETEYLKTLTPERRSERFESIAALQIPAFIITKGLEPLPELLPICRRHGLPVLRSPALSSSIIKRLSYFLEEHLVPSTILHGVLMDVYGLGVLLIGDSGVGKSECALDLITRGHSLVADDRVTIKQYPHGDLLGFCEETLRHHMELRGLGIINVRDLFGLAAVRERKSIETVYKILDTPCPYIRMPVALGRNLSILVEIAARNHVLKLQGHHSAREFARKLEHQLEMGRQQRDTPGADSK